MSGDLWPDWQKQNEAANGATPSPPSGTASGEGRDGPDWAKCQCVRDPRRQDYGPAQDCPQHGDVRTFAAWLAECNDELQRRSAALADAQRRIEAVEALCVESETVSAMPGYVLTRHLHRALTNDEQEQS